MAVKKDPMDMDDDSAAAEANERAVAKVKEGIKKTDTGETEVEVDDDDDDEEALTPGAPPTPRREKRSERLRDMIAAAKAEARAEVLEQQLERTRQAPQQFVQQRQAAPQKTMHEREKELNLKEQTMLLAEYNNLPQEVQQARAGEYQTKAQELRERENDLNYEIRKARDGGTPGVQDPVDTYLSGKYADVVQRPQYLQWAQGYWQMNLQRRVASGELTRAEALEQSLEAARKEFKLPGAKFPEPSRQTRERHSSTRFGSTGAPNGASKVTISKEESSMALAFYKHLKNVPDATKLKMWAKKHKLRRENA